MFPCNYNRQIFGDLFFSIERICSEFETIRETALKIPENTDDIIQLIDYINYTKTEGIAELKEKIQVVIWHRHLWFCLTLERPLIDWLSHLTVQYRSVFWQEVCRRLFYLCDVHTFERDEMELNATVFLWPEKILSVFQLCDEVLLANPRENTAHCLFHTDCQHRLGTLVCSWDPSPTRQRRKKDCQLWFFFLQVIERAKEKGMDELLAKRGRLRVQLEKVLRRITEFPFFSELDMIQQVWCIIWCLASSFKYMEGLALYQ